MGMNLSIYRFLPLFSPKLHLFLLKSLFKLTLIECLSNYWNWGINWSLLGLILSFTRLLQLCKSLTIYTQLGRQVEEILESTGVEEPIQHRFFSLGSPPASSLLGQSAQPQETRLSIRSRIVSMSSHGNP